MQERQVTLDGETLPLPRPFLVLATQNPIELEGTFPLPEAQIDRFLIKLPIGYPSEREENDILLRFERSDPLAGLGPAGNASELQTLQKQVCDIKVETSVRNYVVAIVRATREHADVALGVSPRGTMALYHTAQAWAAIHARHFVLPDDVKTLAPYVLTHRVLLAPQIRLRGRRPEDIIAEVVNTTPVPVES
jgi:MoxR-like ATPase